MSEYRSLGDDDDDPDDDDLPELPEVNLSLSVVWMITADYKLTTDQALTAALICKEEHSGHLYHVDLIQQRYAQIVYH